MDGLVDVEQTSVRGSRSSSLTSPLGGRTRRFRSGSLGEGTFVFRVSLGKVWRLIALPADASLDDLVDWILRSVKFEIRFPLLANSDFSGYVFLPFRWIVFTNSVSRTAKKSNQWRVLADLHRVPQVMTCDHGRETVVRTGEASSLGRKADRIALTGEVRGFARLNRRPYGRGHGAQGHGDSGGDGRGVSKNVLNSARGACYPRA